MKDQFIEYMCGRGGGGGGGGGVGKWLTTYFSLIPLIILPRRFFSDFWNFYTKPIILMS